MKKLLLILALFFTKNIAFACEVCEKRQPKLLKGIAHGASPENDWDYIIVWGTVAITVVSLFFAVKWLVKPGETEENHIKRTFLTFE